MTDNTIDPRRVEYLPLDEVAPDSRNPKNHDTELIDASIGRFGMLDLIVRDGRTGKIISGHGRHKVLSAMSAKGETPPEGIRTDDEGRWLIPVVTGWSSRTDTEAAAALIAMNKTTELGGWVDDELLSLLDDLEEAGEGAMIGVGISDKEIEDLRRVVGEAPDLDALADEWDGTGVKGEGAGGKAGKVTLTLTDSDVIEAWDAQRATFESDDAALGALLEQ